jgi:pyruvate dehydrogenase E2 component (dihydrolipoamide acetyltransferase)
MAEVVMPRLSDSMEEGTILKWLKATGDEVHRGDELVEIETDKATMTYEADSDGVLEIVATEGETLAIGAVIARLSPNGAAAPASVSEVSTDGHEVPTGEQAPAAPVVVEGTVSAAAALDERESAAPGSPIATPHAPGVAAPAGADGHRVKASPVARRIALEGGLDLTRLSGSGPGGRIVRADVEAALAAGGGPGAPVTAARAATAPAAAPSAPPPPVTTIGGDIGTAKGSVAVQELSRTQQVVARRMAESKATVPHFTLETEIEMERCVELRTQLRELEGEQPVPSYNDMIVRACALALREYPRANGAYRDGRFELYSRVNVGIAVAAQDALVVPTIFDADAKSLRTIAAESRALAERVRAGVITPPELSGGTFTVSNLGMYGVTNFTAVINPPQAAILAVGALRDRVVAVDREPKIRSAMAVTLACDHRILYGADAAQFLARIRALLERPLSLLL